MNLQAGWAMFIFSQMSILCVCLSAEVWMLYHVPIHILCVVGLIEIAGPCVSQTPGAYQGFLLGDLGHEEQNCFQGVLRLTPWIIPGKFLFGPKQVSRLPEIQERNRPREKKLKCSTENFLIINK